MSPSTGDFVLAGVIAPLLAVLGVWVALWVPSVASADPFDRVDRLDTALVRGQSTEDDVRRLLGKPDGRGAARVPPAWATQAIWYYEEALVHSSKWNPEIRDGRVEADAEGRFLLVFFSDRRFDGYLWFGVRVEGEDLP